MSKINWTIERLFAIFLLIEVLFSIVIILYLGEYAGTLFLLLPFTVGAAIGAAHKPEHKNFSAYTIAIFCGIAGICGVLIAGGVEGLLCILMAIPFIGIPLLIGYFVGRYMQKIEASSMYLLVPLLVGQPVSFAFDVYNNETFTSSVRTEVTIAQPTEKVWARLTQPVQFSEANNWWFAHGVTHPTEMRLIQKDKNRFLACKTNNESEVLLEILALDSLKMMRFAPIKDVVPMRELTLYRDIHPPHLDGYLKITSGEFRLEPLPNNATRLIATTHYTYRISPNWYWQRLSNYLIGKMHEAVLEDIKKDADTM